MKNLACFVFVFLISFAVFAQEATEPEPLTPDDNECYSNGTMEGRCNSDVDGDGEVSQAEIDWAWNCGWYMARFNAGVFERGNVPYWCASLLPPLSTINIVHFHGTSTQICINAYGNRFCLLGNYLSSDYGNDGTIDDEFYGFDDATLGVNPNITCPSGGPNGINLGDTSTFLPDVRQMMYSQGWSPTDDWCWF